MKKYIFQILVFISAILLTTFIMIEPTFASPGGQIASVIFQTFWGKVLLFILIILFFPLIIYTIIREYFAQRRSFKDLRLLATFNKQFDWLTLQERITDCFYRVHAAWHKQDMIEASEWMTDWYWRNQQLVCLDQWAKDGHINHCRLKKITDIRPLYLAYRGNEPDAEGSRIVVSISANMEDYLADRETGEVVEGKKGFQEIETVWTFVLKNGQWVVANIEEDSLSLTYAQLANELPAEHTEGYKVKSEKIF